MEVGGISGVDSSRTGDLGSLEDLMVEAAVLLSLLRLGRTLKRFLLVDKELADALRLIPSLKKKHSMSFFIYFIYKSIKNTFQHISTFCFKPI